MDTFNIIVDWHFCQCIERGPKETYAYLSLLANLSRPETRKEIVFDCMNELVKTDIPLQIYALPKIFGQLSSQAFRHANLANIMSEYFENLAAIVPVEFSGLVKGIFKAVLQDESDHNILFEQLSGLVGRLQQDHRVRRDDTYVKLPYRDIYDFSCEIFVLTVTAHIIKENKALAGELPNSAAFMELIQKAFDYKYGRMGFLLACVIMPGIATGIGREAILGKIFRLIQSDLVVEPDIVTTYCKIWSSADSADVTGVIGILSEEYENLTHFKEIYLRIKDRDNVFYENMLALWQSALITEAVTVNVAMSAELLRRCWSKPEIKDDQRLGCPAFFRNSYPDKKIAWLLVNTKLKSGAIDFDSSETVAWPYLSPFLKLRNRPEYMKNAFGESVRTPAYHSADSRAAWIGLATALFNSVRILQAIPEADLKDKICFVELIVHAFHVATDFRPWLKYVEQDRFAPNVHWKEKRLTLELGLTGLILTCWYEIKLLSEGVFDALDPELFIKCRPAINQNQGLADDRAVTHQIIYRSVLIDWIYDLYGGCLPGTIVWKWIEILPLLYNETKSMGINSRLFGTSDKLQLASLMRYLPDCPQLSFDELDWEHAKGEQAPYNPLEWNANFRYFLINQHGKNAIDWEKADWKKPNDKKNEGGVTDLVRSVERFVAVRKRNENRLVSSETQTKWEADFRENLVNLRQTLDITRLLRLRLIELLPDSELWRGAEDLRELVVFLVFEFGGPFDRYRLMQAAFNEPGEPLNLPASSWKKSLVRAIIHNTMTSSDRVGTSLRVQSYHKLKMSRVSNAALLQLRAALAVFKDQDLGNYIKAIAANYLEDMLAATPGKCISYSMPYFNGKDSLDTADFISPPYLQDVQAVWCDVNEKTARVFFKSVGKSPLTNFLLTGNASTAPARSYQDVLGVFAGISQLPKGDAGMFNCGLSSYVKLPVENCRDFIIGETVSLKLKNLDGKSWEAISVENKKTNAESRLRKIKLCQELLRPGIWKWYFLNPDGGEFTDVFEKDYFLPDVSAFFRKMPEFIINCRYNGKSYEPLPGSFPELLMSLNIDNPVTLTFISAQTSGPESCWLFSYTLGSSFKILESDLYRNPLEDHSRQFTDELGGILKRYGSALGLLVTFFITVEAGRPLLKLAKRGTMARGEAADNGYPNLKTPFDRRNVYWKNWLTIMEDEDKPFIAIKSNNDQYFLKTADKRIPGFPDIMLRISNMETMTVSGEVTIGAEGWGKSYRVAETWAEPARSYQICDGNPEWLDRFVPEYLRWQTGEIISLRRIMPSTSQGNTELNGISIEGLGVRIETESLDLLPVGRDDQFSGGNYLKRQFAISMISNWRLLGAYDDNREFRLIAGAEITQQLKNGGWDVEGVIVEKLQAANDRCGVTWLLGKETKTEAVTVDGLSELKYYAGYKIVAFRRNGELWCRLFKRDILVSALWEITSEPAPGLANDKPLFEKDGFSYYTNRTKPGLMFKRPANTPSPLATSFRVLNGRGIFGRIILTDLKENILTGYGKNIDGAYLKSINYDLYQTNRLWRIKRQFELDTNSSALTSQTSQLPSYLPEEEILQSYFERPFQLTGSYRPRNNYVIVNAEDIQFQLGAWYSESAGAFSVAPGRLSFISDVNYDPNFASFLLIRDDEQIFADFTNEFLYETPEQFEKTYLAYCRQAKTPPLYFVEKMTVSKSGKPVPAYLFEWGFGRSVLVPADQLYINAEEIVAEPELFNGDKVLELNFIRKNVKSTGQLIINIKSYLIEYSQNSVVYLQHKRQKVVHLIKVEKTDNDRIRIKEVIGPSESNVYENFSYKTKRPEINLTDKQLYLLLNKFKSQNVNELHVYGRVNEKKFTAKQQLAFDCAGFDNDEKSDFYIAGERLPLQVIAKEKRKNDTVLILVPVDTALVEPNGRELQMSRRLFSVRENLLTKIDFDEIKGKIYFVKIVADKRGMQASLVDSLPKKIKVLSDLINLKKHVFGIVKSVDNEMVVELKPGVIFNIENGSYRINTDAGLEKGDRVRISNANPTDRNQVFLINLASLGDRSFITFDGRPCVILPKNSLANKGLLGKRAQDIDIFLLSRDFSIGDLANATAGLPIDKSGRRLFDLMANSHPKLAWIARNQNGLVINQAAKTAGGKILLRKVGENPSARLTGIENEFPLLWEQLTFAQCGVDDVVKKIKNARWQYHDAFTFKWNFRDGTIAAISETEIHPNTLLTGTVFFQEYKAGLKLRYDLDVFGTFTLPVEALIDDLMGQTNKIAEYTFAGRTADRCCWVEIAPGRIAEISRYLLVSGAPLDQSLENLNWQNFAPGDKIKLKLIQSGGVEPERLVLLNIKSGNRSAFSDLDCLAPVAYLQPGRLQIGIGHFAFLLPTYTVPSHYRGMIRLNGNNEIFLTDHYFDSLSPRKPVVVFMGKNMHVAEIGSARIVKPVNEDWVSDPLFTLLFPGGSFSLDRFNELVQLLGGAIPVTLVKNAGENNNNYFTFSRKNQINNQFLFIGQVSLCEIVGFMHGYWLFRSGTQLLGIEVERALDAVPEILRFSLIKLLKTNSIWLQRDKNGFYIGFKFEAPNSEVDAEIIGFLGEAPGPSGLLCRSTLSGRYYWVPSELLGWSAIPADKIAALYPQKTVVRVKIIEDNNVLIASLVHTNEALSEFRRLKIGAELSVTPIPASIGLALVRVKTTGIIVECRDNLSNGQGWLAEVISKSKPSAPFRLLVSGGTNGYRLDLPEKTAYSNKAFERLSELFVSLRLGSENVVNDLITATADDYYSGGTTIQDVMQLAKSAAASVHKDFSVFATEATRMSWSNLSQV